MVQGSIYMHILSVSARRRICLSLSLSLAPASSPNPFLLVRSLYLILTLPCLVDPKYQRTIKYSADDSFVTGERKKARAI